MRKMTETPLLTAELYEMLHSCARRHLERERCDHTLQPTALVHEAFLKLSSQHRVTWKNQAQFLAVAAMTMRRILVDYARGRTRMKRRSGANRVALERTALVFERTDIDLITLDDLLSRFALLDARAAQVVEFRIFVGMTFVEIGKLLEVSERSARNDWEIAKAWLGTQFSG